MLEFFLSVSVHLGFVFLLLLILAKMNRVSINSKWVAFSLVLFLTYFVVLLTGSEIIPVKKIMPDLNWNWGGKIAGIFLSLLVLFVLIRFNRDFKAADAGFTLKQKTGSITPAIIATILFVLLQLILSALLVDGPDYDVEELLYQASMPGLDEELMFRGLLLYAFSLAIISARFNFLGAQINVAGLILVLLFGLVHGVMYSSGEWYFSLISVLLTGSYGFILLWLRERTGSLIFPIVAHNLVNFSGQFV